MVPDEPQPVSDFHVRSLFGRAGDAAVWPGLYAGGVLWLLAWLVGAGGWSARNGLGTLFVVLCSHAGYLLDRVKTRSALLDPADAAAQPARAAFVRRHQRAIRVWIVLLLIAACGFGWALHPLLALVPLGTGIGVLVYAGRPAGRGPARPKDWPMLKGLWIAAAHAALAGAALLAVAGESGRESSAPFVWTIGLAVVFLIVLGDAILCDLDDLDADRAFGTRSVPVVLGSRSAWLIAAASASLGSVLSLLLFPWPGAVLLGVLMLGSYAISGGLRQRRDFIDARFAVIAATCVLV